MLLIADNGGFLIDPTLVLSTKKMSRAVLGYQYESCLFSAKDHTNVVLEVYDSLDTAVAGHKRYKRKYKLK